MVRVSRLAASYAAPGSRSIRHSDLEDRVGLSSKEPNSNAFAFSLRQALRRG